MRRVETAGERLAVSSELGWVGCLLDEIVGSGLPAGDHAVDSVSLRVEAERDPFSRDGMVLVTRGAWSDGERVLVADACSSGFDLLVDATGGVLYVTARYRPASRTRLANSALRSRFRLLTVQTLVHYPVLWRAGLRGRVPLHASVLAAPPAGVVLIAGPGGVGKSTMLVSALASGAVATSDNVCVSSGRSAYGLVEPLRLDLPAARGRRTSHGRRETELPGRVPSLTPDRLIALRRSAGPNTDAVPSTPAAVARALVAGTYAAGELRRYWAFAATLALATGRGPAHPPVEQVATELAEALPCLEIRLGTDRAPATLATLLSGGAVVR